jgi:hypothetical protein
MAAKKYNLKSICLKTQALLQDPEHHLQNPGRRRAQPDQFSQGGPHTAVQHDQRMAGPGNQRVPHRTLLSQPGEGGPGAAAGGSDRRAPVPHRPRRSPAPGEVQPARLRRAARPACEPAAANLGLEQPADGVRRAGGGGWSVGGRPDLHAGPAVRSLEGCEHHRGGIHPALRHQGFPVSLRQPALRCGFAAGLGN